MLQATEQQDFCTLIVPCFNEARRLPVQTFIEFLSNYPSIDLLFVNDGSSDNTLNVLEDIRAANTKQVDILNLTRNQGKAEAIRQGVLRALDKQPSFIGFWDADLATPLGEAIRFLQILEARPHVDVLLASRVNLLGRSVHRDPKRHYAGRIFATLASLVLQLNIYDSQCGAKLFRNNGLVQKIFSEKFLSRWIFDVELIARFLLSYKGNREVAVSKIIEEPVLVWNDVSGSKVKAKDGLRAFYDLVLIRRFIQKRSNRS